MALKRLLVSIHDVSPRHFARLREIDAFLTPRVGARYAMLVVPNFWNAWPLTDHGDFCAWLQERSQVGVEMILHGFSHCDETAHETKLAQLKATSLTAGEGEFLGLSRTEAARRIDEGQVMLRQIFGAPAQGFVAPAWLYGDGANAALADAGFAFAEDHWRVWSPVDGHALARSPVISYASRSRARIASSLLWSHLATKILAPLSTLRLAIHPHDFDVPRLVDEIARAMDALLSARAPASYRDLAASVS